jgi:hypothetical protein
MTYHSEAVRKIGSGTNSGEPEFVPQVIGASSPNSARTYENRCRSLRR